MPTLRRRPRTREHLAAALACASLASGCRDGSPRGRFDADVAPALEGRCLGGPCHGVTPAAEAAGARLDKARFEVRVDAQGRIADLDDAYAITKSRIDTTERPELSSLLRKPTAREHGGVPHLGGAVFADRSDPAYATLRDWIASEEGGGEDGDVTSLRPEVRQFASEVLPIIASRQCMNGSCHGSSAPFTALDPPVVLDGVPTFSVASIRANHAALRPHLHLAGDPRLSRLLRKILPLERGGILHRGGNDIFLRGIDDAAAGAILRWAEAERAATLGDAPIVTGIVLVRGPVSPSRPFTFDELALGTDLFVLEPPAPGGALRNLTASAHQGPADVRDPAVRHDGERIAFAMRRSADEAHQIWEIAVDGSGLRQLTHDDERAPGGGHVANVQPTYGPDGRVYFVSTRTGHLADGMGQLDTEIWAVSPADGALERITHDPAPEATPVFFGVGKSYGTLAFTVLRTTPAGQHGVAFRMPLDHNKHYHGDPELHVHHGLTAPGEVLYGTRAMPDGRFVGALVGTDAELREGRLALFDRQIGPEIPDSQSEKQSSLGGYRRAFALLDDGVLARARHPVPLPDGRVLCTVARAVPTGQPPDLGLHVVTLEEDRATGHPRVAARDVLLDEAGVSEYDAEPIVRRPPEDDTTHTLAWDPTADRGNLDYRHVETLEALFASLAAAGPKTLRDDLVYARVIESLPVTPAELDAGPLGLGRHGRSRILAEVPLAGGSLHLSVPAGTPLRIQTLGADRMTRGRQHDRWLDVAPGQTFPGGVAPALYPTLCAGCHGSLSGMPESGAGPVPDIVTTASVTHATHQDLDPRRPLPPLRVGDAPIAVDFRKDVAPLLARSCAGCHGPPSPAGGLSLIQQPTASFDTAYEALLATGVGSGGGRRYVDDRTPSARASVLVEHLTGSELDAPAPLSRACPGEPPLDDAERLTIVRWIELGALYRGTGP